MARWANALRTKDEIFRMKRLAVLRAAGHIFSRRGFHNTSLDDIAKHLNVSKGTLYNYLKDKQEILFEFHKLALDIGNRSLDEGFAADGNGADKVRLVIRQYIARLNEELGGYGVIAEVGALKPEDRKEVISRRDAFDARFVELLEIGRSDGSLRHVDPKMAVFTFMGALITIPNWFSPTGRLTGEAVADQMTDLLMNGMAAVPSAA